MQLVTKRTGRQRSWERDRQRKRERTILSLAERGASQVMENVDGIVHKSFPESDAQPVGSVESLCPPPVLVRSSEVLWLVFAEFLDCIPSVVRAAEQSFTEVHVQHPEDTFSCSRKSSPRFRSARTALFIAPRSTFTHKVRGTTAPEVYGKTNLPSEESGLRLWRRSGALNLPPSCAARAHRGSSSTPGRRSCRCLTSRKYEVFCLTLVSQPHDPVGVLHTFS